MEKDSDERVKIGKVISKEFGVEDLRMNMLGKNGDDRALETFFDKTDE